MSDCSTEAFKAKEPHARMEKTKRQLRAEAVERLRKIRDSRYPICNADIGAAIASGNIDSAIDLLTDDELPEADVAAILRKAASYDGDYSGPGEALRRLTDSTTVYYALETLADMIERDYVQGEAWQCDGSGDWFATGLSRHYDQRTLENVLTDFANAAADMPARDSEEWEPLLAKYADEIREIMGEAKDERRGHRRI